MSAPALAAFEAQLKAVVAAKRLSSSKMTALTELAMDTMQADTQMISLLYRTHKALPPSSKVSSLYVFDSIARAAHRTKTKKGLVADLNNPIGNAASFLVRLEGMLDGLVDDMLVHGPPEGKEKTRKVVDIWTREGTFPPGALTRLADKVKTGTAVPSETPPAPAAPATPTTPANAVSSLPPAILALLGGAVATQPQEPPPPPPPQPQFALDPAQLALINQLTKSNTSTPPFSPVGSTPVLPGAPPFSPTAPPFSPTAPSFSPTAPSFSPTQKSPPFALTPTQAAPLLSPTQAHSSFSPTQASSFSPTQAAPPFSPTHNPTPPPFSPVLGTRDLHDSPRSRSPSSTRSPRRDPRLRDDRRFSGPRERGRGRFSDDRDKRFSDDRDRRFSDDRRFSEGGTRHPNERGGRFEDDGANTRFRRRSRSPRGDARTNSRDPRDRGAGSGRAPLPGAGEVGKDEFGRDLRDDKDENGPAADRDRDRDHAQDLSHAHRAQDPSHSYHAHDQNYTRDHAQDHTQNSIPGQGGLGSFDMATFDFTDAAAWTKLATAWEETNGRVPTQEEMMMFVMSGGTVIPGAGGMAPGAGGMAPGAGGGAVGMGASGGIGGSANDMSDNSWGNGSRGRGRGGWQRGFRGRGRGRGRGGGSGGGGFNSGEYGGNEYGSGGYGSDAVVLGGGGDESGYSHGQSYGYSYDGGQDGPAYDNPANTAPSGGGGGSGGGMKKVDGKWVWSKN